MNTSEIKPKTLIAVLAAHIREESEVIARKIVDEMKSNDIEYATLVEQFILKKGRSGSTTFSSFSEKAFEEIKNTSKLTSFSIILETEYRKRGNEKEFECVDNSEFTIKCNLDHKSNPQQYGSDSVTAYGKNVYHVFDEFKKSLASKLASINGQITEIELPIEQ